LILNAANTYTGTTTVGFTGGGTLVQGTAGALPSGNALSIQNVAGSIVDLNGYPASVSNLSGGGPTGGELKLTGANLTDGSTPATTSPYAGVISGNGTLIKEGGAWALTGTNTWTGGLVIQHGGEVQVGSDVRLGDPTGTVTLNNGKLTTTTTVTLPST